MYRKHYRFKEDRLMTRYEVNKMVEDAEECLNQMWASPNITGYKYRSCEASRLSGCIRMEFSIPEDMDDE